jgi:peptide deformylase
MAVLPVLTAPDPRLKATSKPVAKVDDSVRQLMDDMLETMYVSNGIGLAAPQVGVTKRIIVMDLARQDEPPNPLRIANPEIVWQSEEKVVCEEGCLSVPDQYSEVLRPKAVKIRYLDYQNEIRELETDGYLATCIQHEIDHLNGVLFIDHLSFLKRNIILRKLAKVRKLSTSASV